MIFIFLCLICVSPLAAQPVTPDRLRAALQDAPPGSILTLAPGDYGALDWRGGRGVTLTGPPEAVLTGLTIRDGADLRFDGITLDYRFAPGDPPHARPFSVAASRGVHFSNVTFDGDLAQGQGRGQGAGDGFPTGYGLSITASRQITVTDSTLRRFLRGAVVAGSDDIVFAGNDIAGMRSDGLNFAQVRDVAITGNFIHDFSRATDTGDHADMIQFWTNGTTSPSTGITIADNVLHAGAGLYTQSIFMRNDQVDRGLAGAEMFYRDVTITGNVIINAHLHGITVGETDGLTIARNTVVYHGGAAGGTENESVWIPQIRAAPASRNVVITGNLMSQIAGPGGQADWDVQGNMVVQHQYRMEAGYYGRVFGFASLTPPYAAEAFRPAPGGPLDGLPIGAARLATP